MPKFYWDVTLVHANFFINKSPTSTLSGDVLNAVEVYVGRDTHFCMFGAIFESQS